MYSSTCLLVTIWAGTTIVYGQTSLRCFDCNSGGKGFGKAICPPNGNLKRELLTTVRCSERCFSRTIPDKPGVVRRGCSAGIGFFLSRPLPKDGCVQVSSKNWWCFCSESFCNVDDMTRYGKGTTGLIPLEEERVEEPVDSWHEVNPEPTTIPQRITEPPLRLPRPTHRQPVEHHTEPPKKSRENLSVEQPQVEVESSETITESEEPEEILEEPSYEEPLATWEEHPFEGPEEAPSGPEVNKENDDPLDNHYTRHTHHGHEDENEQEQVEEEQPENQEAEDTEEQQPLALP